MQSHVCLGVFIRKSPNPSVRQSVKPFLIYHDILHSETVLSEINYSIYIVKSKA